MGKPELSIVMPAYNAADTIKPTIESILGQTFSDFELLIVDDGSTDNTVSIIESVEDNRIRTVYLEENSGIPSARNRGIEETQGEYVACHDSDDRSRPDRFERQLEYLSSHEEVAALGTGAKLVNESRKTTARRRVLTKPSLLDLVERNHFVGASMMFRRSALEDVGGYDEWFEVAEDYELNLRLAEKFEVRNIDEPMYEIRIHGGSTYASQLEKASLYIILAAKKVMEPKEWIRLKKIADRDGIQAITEDLSRSERQDYHLTIARELLKYGKPEAARDRMRRALTVSKPSPGLYLLYPLSFAPPVITEFTASAYRRLLVNPRLRLSNAQRENEVFSFGAG